MANKGGFVKFYRKMTDWEWYDDLPTRVLFLHLLVTVNWKDGKWHGIEIKRGQRVTSLATLAKETGLSVKQIRTALKHLESTHEVTHQRAHNCTFITVENYSKYQDVPNCEGTPSGTPDGKAGAKQGQSRGKAGATIEEEKEEEEVKKGRIIERGEPKAPQERKAKKRFSPPSVDDVRKRISERGYRYVDAETFVSFYGSKNWMVGKSKMTNWKDALAGWNSRAKNRGDPPVNGSNQENQENWDSERWGDLI